MAALFSANELPHLAWGAAIFGTYRVRWFGFTLQARAASAREALRVDDVRSARTQVFGAAALACPRIIALWRIRLDGCLGPELSFLRAHGIGFSTPKDALLTQYTGLFGLTANLPLLGDLALDLRAFGHLNFNRVGLNYTLLGETREVFTTPRLAFWATTGLSYAF